MRLLVWNLFHGRAQPAAGRPLLVEFCDALAAWEWDVALLQEVPPWWPPLLARAARADHRSVLTSRNSLPAVRRAAASRNPDLLGAWGGGSNAILVRGPILDHRSVVLTRRPERRVAHGVNVPDGTWAVNLHATMEPKERTRADVRRAAGAAREWSAPGPVVLGGDFNLVQPAVPGFERLAGHHVDHVFAFALEAESYEPLDAGQLADHRPLMVTLRR